MQLLQHPPQRGNLLFVFEFLFPGEFQQLEHFLHLRQGLPQFLEDVLRVANGAG